MEAAAQAAWCSCNLSPHQNILQITSSDNLGPTLGVLTAVTVTRMQAVTPTQSTLMSSLSSSSKRPETRNVETSVMNAYFGPVTIVYFILYDLLPI